jgi:hypothetical protein
LQEDLKRIAVEFTCGCAITRRGLDCYVPIPYHYLGHQKNTVGYQSSITSYTRPLSMLCESCLKVFPTLTKDLNELSSTEHHATAASLHRSIQSGCRICTVIWQRLSCEEQQRLLSVQESTEDGCTSYCAAPSPASSNIEFGSDTLLSTMTFSLEFSLDGGISPLATFTIEPAEGG